MDSSAQLDLEEQSTSKLSGQALEFFLHSLLALGSWMALMLLGYAINPSGVPQLVILLSSAAVPLVVGFLVARVYPAEMAALVWLLGLIWFLIVCLWVLDMPTGPNQCFQCDATDKLTRTFFSLTSPSGLIDNDGPFIGTWPAVALVGYSIGAKLGFQRAK
ncbi:MAG: hypothetical protein ABR860_03660 [Terracidiphilus sp.]|jgi:hypothetical protein